MILFIVLMSVAAYAVADLFAARYLYGRMRARAIDNWTYTHKGPVEAFNDDRGFYVTGALALAIVWPLALLGLALYRFMGTTPVRSQHEIKAEADAMARRVKELEKELGIK